MPPEGGRRELMINVKNLTKYYGEVCAVDDISFAIRRGEITGLLGPNGAGKTTTLRILTGFLNATAGNVVVGDYRVDENPLAVKEMIGYLPESAPLYDDMMVYDYLEFVRRIREVESEKRIGEIVDICGLKGVMHKNINELSKGYKQRVGLAHAMIHDPDILILDEPTSGLDPNQIIEIRNLIKEIGKEKTVILSTHILPEVEATCDRVIIVDRGRIVADDSTNQLRSSAGKDITILLEVSGAAFNDMNNSLRGLDGVKGVTLSDERDGRARMSVVTDGERDLRPDVFETIKDNGWTLYEMTREYRSLEHVFRDLTRGGADGTI